VRTVEHLRAACVLAGLDNAVVRVTGEELPAADGSARAFLGMIREAGLVEQAGEREAWPVRESVEVTGKGGAEWVVRVSPAERPSFSFRFRGTVALDGKEASFTSGDNPDEVASARTFCFEREIEALLKAGLGRGGTAENVLVLRDDGTAVNGERVPFEAVRHKLLDLIGDFALAGRPLAGRVAAEATGHAAHVESLRTLLTGGHCMTRNDLSGHMRKDRL